MRLTATLTLTLTLMSRTYTKREIAHNLECSIRTIEDDAAWLGLKPIKSDRNSNLYSQADFDLISQMRSHCNDKNNSRTSFVPTKAVSVVTPSINKVTKIVDRPSNLEKYDRAISIGREQDPLFDLELLQRISDNGWLLPAVRLAPLFGITSKYLNSKKLYEYCGFVASKEVYSAGRVLWKVTANNSK